jgi:hypothetical protein
MYISIHIVDVNGHKCLDGERGCLNIIEGSTLEKSLGRPFLQPCLWLSNRLEQNALGSITFSKDVVIFIF